MNTAQKAEETISSTLSRAVGSSDDQPTQNSSSQEQENSAGKTGERAVEGSLDTDKMSGQEPVSGVEGKGTKEEPFDQGNQGD